MKLFLRILIFLVGMSMCFTEFALPIGGKSYSISFLLVSVYVLCMLPNVFMKFNAVVTHYTMVLFCPVSFFLLLILSNTIHGESGQPVVDNTIASCIILFVCLLIHSESDSEALHLAIVGFGIGAAAFAGLFHLGIGVEYVDQRLEMFGANANTVGYVMYIGSAIIIEELIFKDIFRLKTIRFLFLVPIMLAVPMILESGSRVTTGLLFVLLFILLVTFPSNKKLLKAFLLLTGMTATITLFVYLLSSDSVIGNRMLSAIYEQDTGGRSGIWNVYLPHILENPILGVGQTGQMLISQNYFGKLSHIQGGMSPHNALVEVALLTGFTGLLVMLLFWMKIFTRVVAIYRKYHDRLPVLLALALAAQILTSQMLEIKFAWLICAYIITWENSHRYIYADSDIIKILKINNVI